jgi:hypothetical protein
MSMSDNKGNIDPLYREILSLIRPVIEGFGYALAGGNALRVHGLTNRPTMDVNMFTDQARTVAKVAAPVEEALRRAGFYAERVDRESLNQAAFGDWPEEAEWTLGRGGRQVLLQLACRERRRPTVEAAVGPVLSREDSIAGKVLALVTRYEARDWLDVAAILRAGYTPAQLVELGRTIEPGYTPDEFWAVLPLLGELDDEDFEVYGLRGAEIDALRRQFATWWAPSAEDG